MRSFFLVFVFCSASFALQKDATPAQPRHDAEGVNISVADIRLFWQAYDHWASSNDSSPDKLTEVLQREYLDQGSQGVKDLIPPGIVSASNLSKMVFANPFYQGVRHNAERIETFIPEIRKNLEAFEKLYPEASFPPVYFVIGARSSDGITSDHGLIIGAEMFGDGKDYPHPLSDVVPFVIQELVHFQQKDHSNDFFHSAMREGAADFITQLVVGRNAHEFMKAYDDSHEQEFWQDIRAGIPIGSWKYVDKPTHWELYIPQYVGYRICQSYYQISKDKAAAIKTIMEMRDPYKILEMSGYEQRFNAQAPMPASPTLDIRADVRPARLRLGDISNIVLIVLTLENKSAAPLFLPHPLVTTEALTLLITLPTGEVRSVSFPNYVPGTRPSTNKAELWQGRPQTFWIDLGALLPLDRPGAYSVVVEYPWRPDEVWRSQPLRFTVSREHSRHPHPYQPPLVCAAC